MSRILRPGALVVVFVLALLAAAQAVPSASGGGNTLVVDTTADDPTLFACTSNSGDCSLRGAISKANGVATLDVIQLASNATYLLDEVGADEDTNATGDLDVLGPITLEGNGATIDANGIDRVFDVNIPASETVRFNAVTITGGSLPLQLANIGGAGIRMSVGQLTLDGATVTDNTANAVGLVGAGILTHGDTNTDILNSTISFNTATHEAGSGGGFAKPDGTGSFEIMGSTVDHNTAGSTGGGVYLGLSPGGATFFDTDVTNNTANSVCDSIGIECFGAGGGVFAGAQSVSFFNGSVSNNQAPADSGGGAYVPEIHVSGTTFQNNSAAAVGGAILSFDAAGEIVDALIVSNSAEFGAGLAFGGELSHSIVNGNQATQHGGGVLAQGSLSISHSVIYGNLAGGEGGGVVFGDRTPQINNSTVSENTAAAGGGIARNASIVEPGFIGGQPQGIGPTPGPLTINQSTIANNTAATGANVKPLASLGDTIVRASIIANATAGLNCSGPLLSDGYNVEDQNSCGLTGFHDAVNAEAFLLALDDNGGSTLTHGLAIESPAIDRVLVCPPPTTDQTDDTRPKGNACDSGAFESDFTGPTETPPPTNPPTPTATPVTTATPTPPASATATPLATPTGTPSGDDEVWGDSDCSGQIAARDNQALLRHVLGQAALSQTEPCPDLGHALVEPPEMWGDWDCNGSIGARDNQALLRHVLGQVALSQTEPCPEIGSTVTIAG
jgi:predicted outer membrane repeat protein